MAAFPFDIVAFDLDGTLLETHRDLGTAVNHALVLGGFAAVPTERAKDLIGGGAKVMLQRALDAQGGVDEDRFRELYKVMLAHYSDHYADQTTPYPGAVDALDQLRGREVRLAVVTNKFESFACGILGALDLADRFECIIGGDTLGKGPDGNYRAKPAPDMVWHAQHCCGGGRIAFVGDSTYDMKAGRAAGATLIAASYGYCDVTPEALGADAMIDSLHNLVGVLERL